MTGADGYGAAEIDDRGCVELLYLKNGALDVIGIDALKAKGQARVQRGTAVRQQGDLLQFDFVVRHARGNGTVLSDDLMRLSTGVHCKDTTNISHAEDSTVNRNLCDT